MLDATLDAILAAIGSSWPAEALKSSRLVYPLINALHIVGFALLFGAIALFDLAILLRAKAAFLESLARFAPRVAASGLLLAAIAGLSLFSVQPFDYAANPAFRIKLVLVAAGTLHAVAMHRSEGFRELRRSGEASASVTVSAAVSLLVWIAAILAGRFIAFLA